MADLVQRVAAAIERHAMFDGRRRIGAAVSGGADSVCLVHVLHELSARFELSLTVLHLDHNLRGEESRADAEFVRGLAAGLGMPAVIRETTLPAGNLEQTGREARLAFFGELLSAGRLDGVALGHTRRDQAETVLFRFLRGAGTAGLSGIRPVTSNGIVRPLLEIGREEVEAWLRERGIAWREDASNASRAFARNRIRHDLLPQLARDWNPQIEETLARMAEWAQGEEEYWEGTLGTSGPILDARALRGLPVAAARRLVRRAIEHVKGDLRAVDFGHIEAILALAECREGRGAVQLPGLEVRRSFDQIRISPYPAEGPGGYQYPIARESQPLCLPLPCSSIYLELIEKRETTALSDCVYNDGMGCLDWGCLSGSLVLRNWSPGDRFQPIGSAGPRKLKSMFQMARIPVWERAEWPVLATGASVVWTRRFGVSAVAAAGESTRVILRIREMPKSESGSGAPASNSL